MRKRPPGACRIACSQPRERASRLTTAAGDHFVRGALKMFADPLISLSGRRLLVTGATGFIGARVCRRAVELGATVHAVSRAAQPVGNGLHWERADLADERAVRELVRRVEPDVA